MKRKKIIILEGSDACGKSSLLKHVNDLANGKCHSLHSNYSKFASKQSHFRQHKLLFNFIKKQFDSKHYTENNVVIMDRCYVSDMTYGQIGYGSKGTLKQKFKKWDKLLDKIKGIDTYFIYCRPLKSAFDTNMKEELLTEEENNRMQSIYDYTIYSPEMARIFNKHKVRMYTYNFYTDPDYKEIDKYLED